MKVRDLRKIEMYNYKLVNYFTGKEIEQPKTLDERKKVDEMEVVCIRSKLEYKSFNRNGNDLRIESYIEIEVANESEL